MMWNVHKTSTKVMRIITSSFLILSILMCWSLREYGPVVAQAAEEARTTYVSDVRLFYALDSLEAAKNTLAGEGGTLPTDTTEELTAPGTATFGDITYTEADAGKSIISPRERRISSCSSIDLNPLLGI